MTAIVPYVGACQPHVDTGDARTLACGVKGRIGSVMPPVTLENYYSLLREYVLNWLKERGVKPLAPDYDFSVVPWLETTSYTLARKLELSSLAEECLDPLERNNDGSLKHFIVKLFTKDETYPVPKHGRGIFARSDIAKIYFGPVFKAIEKVIFDPDLCPEFVKKIPVRERGEYVMSRLYNEGHVYVATDYSSFECHFNSDLMENCEFLLYEHLLSAHPKGPEYMSIIKEVLTGKNRIYNKNLTAEVLACRMSGEMNTSLGNGFSNLMLMSFVCSLRGIEPRCVIEGDDGLLSVPYASAPTTEDFTQLGCKIKLVTFNRISEASFCGLIFDEEDRQVLTDPIDVITSFGWGSSRYCNARDGKRKALLRSKCLSLLSQYPACPIVSEAARAGLRFSASYDVRWILEHKGLSLWERDQLREAVDRGKFWNIIEPIGMGSRNLVAEVFNLPVDLQLQVEEYFRTCDLAQGIHIPALNPHIPDSFKQFWDGYVFTDSSLGEYVEITPPVWASQCLTDEEMFGKREIFRQ